jgi:hypothetical protein
MKVSKVGLVKSAIKKVMDDLDMYKKKPEGKSRLSKKELAENKAFNDAIVEAEKGDYTNFNKIYNATVNEAFKGKNTAMTKAQIAEVRKVFPKDPMTMNKKEISLFEKLPISEKAKLKKKGISNLTKERRKVDNFLSKLDKTFGLSDAKKEKIMSKRSGEGDPKTVFGKSRSSRDPKTGAEKPESMASRQDAEARARKKEIERKKKIGMNSGGLVTADYYFKRKVGKRK